MSNTSQFQKTSNKTTTVTDSYNSTNTVNRVFDNVGNTEVYLNSDVGKPSSSGGSGIDKNLLIAAAAVIAGVMVLKK